MRLSILFLLAGFMQLSAESRAQHINLSFHNTSLQNVFNEIEKQSGYQFFYNEALMKKGLKLSVTVKQATLEETLALIFSKQPLSYSILREMVIVKEKQSFRGDSPSKTTITMEEIQQNVINVQGKVVDSLGNPLRNATIKIKGSNIATLSNVQGEFTLRDVDKEALLQISYLGYISKEVKAKEELGMIVLFLSKDDLDDVEVTMNLGLYQVPKERATGSFTHIDQKLLSRSVGSNILQRLEGIANGVQFTEAGSYDPKDIRVRGVATIRSDNSPLIIIDDFPYEGNIDQINPNDVESITILKDAAAASIWGARAGNGVIVVTTKQGRYNEKAKISLTSSVNIGTKPDLLYNQKRLPSELVMEIEKEKYLLGGYYKADDKNQTPFPEYVELLIKKDQGTISETYFLTQESLMKNTEIREEVMKYLYQPSMLRQYAMNVFGGGQAYRYYFSAGYDQNETEVIGNGGNRLNLGMTNTFNPKKGLELTAGVWYSLSENTNNGLTIRDLEPLYAVDLGLSPYMRLKDEHGNNASVLKQYRLTYIEKAEENGLLDWNYRPLDEIKLNDNRSNTDQLRLNGGIRYSFLTDFNVNATYQYTRNNQKSLSYYDPESFYVRNLVNRLTQSNGSRVLAHGGILKSGIPSETASHSGRIQLNHNKRFGLDHQLVTLIGGEIRNQVQETFPAFTLYNYDKELLTGTAYFDYTKNHDTLPTGKLRLEQPSNARNRYIDRYLSYYGNTSYSYKERYILSGSVRWDGSNIFGVKTNQKGTPLWSVGGSWEASKESFYTLDWLPYLRARLTYGSSGNVNKNVSAYPVVSHNGADGISGLNNASIRSAGNPSLRWERINTTNGGIDFSTKNRRITASIDYFIKKASDLIGEDYLAPNTGIIEGGTAANTNLINYADLKTKGWDIQLITQNIKGDFNWESTFLVNYVKNKITNYTTNKTTGMSDFINIPAKSVIGRSRDVVYALHWHGLNEKGFPIVYIDGQVSDDYALYMKNFIPEELLIAGLRIPPLYGSIRNDFYWKNLGLSVLLSWKSDYVFRRTSTVGANIYAGDWWYHMDYLKRWQKPGDEKNTNVAAFSTDADSYRDQSYSWSQALITNGDHIRLQDINLSYNLRQKQLGSLPIQSVRLYAYARNLGILWKANSAGLDPDYPSADYFAPKTFAFGLQIDF